MIDTRLTYDWQKWLGGTCEPGASRITRNTNKAFLRPITKGRQEDVRSFKLLHLSRGVLF